MEAERKENQSEELDSSAQQENSKETAANGPVLPVNIKPHNSLHAALCYSTFLYQVCVFYHYFPQAAEPKSALTQSSLPSPAQSFSSLLPKALATVLQVTRPPGHSSHPQHSRNPPNVQQLQTELRELRGDFEQMKSQHKYVFDTVI